jgi:renalase
VDTFGQPLASHLRPRSVAVIGAGPAGIVASSRLHAAGVDVVIYEKSQGIGGRVATRRTSQGFTFDHGAQYVTARNASFTAYLAESQASGLSAPWDPDVDPPRARHSEGSVDATTFGAPRRWYVGVPGMSSLFRPLCLGLTVRKGVTVTRVDATDHGIWLAATDPTRGSLRIGAFDAAIIAIPAPQASTIAGHLPDVAEALARVVISPCWALMVAMNGYPPLPADVVRRVDGPVAWVARDTSKPGRTTDLTTFVVHASPEWSSEHLEDPPDVVRSLLLEAASAAVGARIDAPSYAVAHRWRYAQTVVPLGAPFLETADGRVLVGGDWTLGARVESAWESGEAMAERILRGKP